MSARTKRSSGKSVAQKSPRKSITTNKKSNKKANNKSNKSKRPALTPKQLKERKLIKRRVKSIVATGVGGARIIRPKGLPVALTNTDEYEALMGLGVSMHKVYWGLDGWTKVKWVQRTKVGNKMENVITWNRIIDLDGGDLIINVDIDDVIMMVLKYFYRDINDWKSNGDDYYQNIIDRNKITGVRAVFDGDNNWSYQWAKCHEIFDKMKWMDTPLDIEIDDGKDVDYDDILVDFIGEFFKNYIMVYTYEVYGLAKHDKQIWNYWQGMCILYILCVYVYIEIYCNIFKYNICFYTYLDRINGKRDAIPVWDGKHINFMDNIKNLNHHNDDIHPDIRKEIEKELNYRDFSRNRESEDDGLINNDDGSDTESDNESNNDNGSDMDMDNDTRNSKNGKVLPTIMLAKRNNKGNNNDNQSKRKYRKRRRNKNSNNNDNKSKKKLNVLKKRNDKSNSRPLKRRRFATGKGGVKCYPLSDESTDEDSDIMDLTKNVNKNKK